MAETTPIIRPDGRKPEQLRPLSLTPHVNPYAEGSCLVEWGKTRVLCTTSIQEGTPRWLRGQGKGWLTAEYGMLPRATGQRKDREAVRGKQDGRTVEIQRLIGRSLRAVCNLHLFDGYTFYIDCDVLVADGGTRVASITGAYVAAELAARQMIAQGKIAESPFHSAVAAVSCGVTAVGPVLDMDYVEDSTTFADGNFVMGRGGEWIESQISAEQRPLSSDEMNRLQHLAATGIAEIFSLQDRVLSQTA